MHRGKCRTGLLRRERGRGTVVNRSEFEQPLGTAYSLFQSQMRRKKSVVTSELREMLDEAGVIVLKERYLNSVTKVGPRINSLVTKKGTFR